MPLALLIIILPLLAFWLWMFNDMLNNPTLPLCYMSLSGGRNVRQDWIVAFVVLNVFTASYYYLTEHKSVN